MALLVVSAAAAQTLDQPALNTLLKGIEARYNHARTMEVSFFEQYTPPASPQRTESGVLYLRKPMRMRCDYTLPKGKLCVSDGTNLYLYTPSDNKAMKTKLKESLTEDMQAPLAFLLGKLNFDKEFKNIQAHPEGSEVRITCQPKNEIFAGVEFLIGSDKRIEDLKITYVDRSVLNFVFTNEKLDLPLSDKLFAFQLPVGAQWDETAQ